MHVVRARMSTDFLLAMSLALSAPIGMLLPHDRRVAAIPAAEEGPAALERLLAQYDALADGPQKDALEARIDAVAGQKYATVSRLYWHTDLGRAQTAARESGRPILSLRMLGRLDEDFSCANSRLFRVVLYANEDVSRFLRENFVLHWSSERPVPKVTIDFGDGRTLHTTLAGNSAHYVLDADGHPLDVLPGLYGPVAFQRELEAILPLARESWSLSTEERAQRLFDHHRARGNATHAARAEEKVFVDVPVGLVTRIEVAEQRAFGKSRMEMPAVAGLGLAGPFRRVHITPKSLEEARLDVSSRELVRRLAPTDWAVEPRALEGEHFDALIAMLEACVAQDTRTNEFELRRQIRGWFLERTPLEFADLNDRIYGDVFLTPAADPWLGIGTLGTFTGLPGDGIERQPR